MLQRLSSALRRGWGDDNHARLDEAHSAVWAAVRHLFPAHAMVNQADDGLLLVSWSIAGDGRRNAHFASPVMIRIEPGLLVALWAADTTERKVLARLQERVVRAELAGYDPRARIPTARVIVLGEEAFA